MSDESKRELFFRAIFERNPITLLVLGICSALAVTGSMATALVMSIALTLVTACASAIISILRHRIPNTVRIGIQITIIATLVILVDQVLQAFFYDLSRQLSIYVGLIITNCIVMGRAEGFAMSNSPGRAFVDGVGNGLGYSFILMTVAFWRELLGAGTLFGYTILQPAIRGGWYETNGLMLLPASAFFLVALLIWLLREIYPSQLEK
ncbi:NADH:ubiquinone reductase (Na(+)-transporting) subunit D [Desulfurivibrio sp. C05AmB]|jgi:Na+-transporting NADH:ubiquinone oxidoreductase subunit D|uniref:NADH:ubiquinone reductase (Na(+)-transporting) subunit D n=1 Tax=Desulfurivibrio sp. C05AmB TaxID=3374371 RepID=UPI00376EAD2B